MDYVNLGNSGLKVSRICLGCMTYGDPADPKRPWVLTEEESRGFFRQALDAGINFFDTANIYSLGRSEEVTGRALRDFVPREEVVIATKVGLDMRAGDPNGRGLSRKAIMDEIDASLRRLGTDYVDLYQVHRWDAGTPIEETLDALNDVVRAGKARYLGASSMWAWQFMQALGMQRARGWSRFISMQGHYNLIYREEEREMLPLCQDQGIGLIPWSPLARGRLARAADENSRRGEMDAFGRQLYGDRADTDHDVIDSVGKIAAARGVSRAQIALAWLLARPGVVAPVLGATKAEHLQHAVAALDISLTEAESSALEQAYVSPWPPRYR